MTTLRTHYDFRSGKIIKEILPCMQDTGAGSFKPFGFWYSVDRSWEEWCHGEMLEWIAKGCYYEVTLGQENILQLKTAKAITDFTLEYLETPAWARKALGTQSSYLTQINWVRVAEKYDGIEIAPYQWELRLALGFMWYYSWDCASGVIWRPKGTMVKLLWDERTTTAETDKLMREREVAERVRKMREWSNVTQSKIEKEMANG